MPWSDSETTEHAKNKPSRGGGVPTSRLPGPKAPPKTSHDRHSTHDEQQTVVTPGSWVRDRAWSNFRNLEAQRENAKDDQLLRKKTIVPIKDLVKPRSRIVIFSIAIQMRPSLTCTAASYGDQNENPYSLAQNLLLFTKQPIVICRY
jgi:hypothetical protein